MNLTICLLLARRFVEREQIRELVAGYHGLSDTAFERTFERDKEELRTLGVPVETGSNSVLFPDDVGYRIRRRDFELPEIDFAAAELAALGVASTVWDDARLQEEAVKALAKLRAAGLDPDGARVAGFAPTVAAREPGFEALWDATLTGRPVGFGYRGVDRVVEPWRLLSRHGAWYLIGYDRTRGAGRSFKVSRLEGPPRPAPGTVRQPAPGEVERHLASLAARRDKVATLAVREGAAHELVRFAEPADAAAPAGFGVWRTRTSSDAGEIASYGSDVIVLDPPELIDAVRVHLEAVAAWA